MQPKRPTVSVILPTLNEARNLPLVLPHIPIDLVDEVIVVDGRSTDGTVEVARQLVPSVRIILEAQLGKGAALRAGYEAARGDIVICMDADGSHDPREIPRFLRALMEGADFVKGSRFAPHGGTTDMPRIRKVGNAAFVQLVNLLFDGTFTDITYGYHAFWRYCLGLVEYRDIHDFSFEIALYIRVLAGRLRVVEVPSFEGYRFTGVGKLQTIPDGLRILKTILIEWLASWRKLHVPNYLGFRGGTRTGWEIVMTGLAANAYTKLFASDGRPPSASVGLNSLDAARSLLQALMHSNLPWSANSEFDETISRILRLTVDAVGAASGSIVLLDEQSRYYYGAHSYAGRLYQFSVEQWENVLRPGLAGWVLESGQPVLVPNTREDDRWLRRPWDEAIHSSRSALLVPLFLHERVAGVLTLVRARNVQFSADDLKIAATLAPVAGSI